MSEERQKFTPRDMGSEAIKPRKIVSLSFEKILGSDNIRIKRCNGEYHWLEEQKMTEIATGEIDVENYNPGSNFECDCQDKENRKDVFDIFR